MSTEAQILANIANAQQSTGPRTEAGKATASQNSVTHGLYAGDFIRPGEEAAYASLNRALLDDLKPAGILEETFADEIRRAMWRLRRCGEAEAGLVRYCVYKDHVTDPMEEVNAPTERIQKTIDRARSQAHRLLHKCLAELRRLQAIRKAAATVAAAKQTQFENPEPARNAPCPCNSGLKFKRCCGKSAPALAQAA